MKKYAAYKDSGIKWIGEIPKHWKYGRLKNFCYIIPSNIDKKSYEGENEVLLCNYVDVYKNDNISGNITFMQATASDTQIQKLLLQTDDVIATKDSEDPTDIGVPAYVPVSLENVVCGYHLTVMRTYKNNLNGNFLFWILKSNNVSQYFSTEARGITRYALGSNAFKNLTLPIPSLEEQQAITNYLNQKTSEIDLLVEKKKQLITLLQEERMGIINHAVTKGIDPNVKLKQSGIEWIGEIPEHWEIKRLKYLVSTKKGFAFKSNIFNDKGTPVIKASDIKNKTIRKNIKHYIDESLHQGFESVKLKTNDILMSTVGSNPEVINSAVGQICKVPSEYNGALLNQNTVKLEIIDNSKLDNDFLFFLIQSDAYRSYLNLYAHGTANQASLKIVDILNYQFVIPHLNMQRCIVEYIKNETNKRDTIIRKTKKEVSLLEQYKTALISEVVMGKVDVREEVVN